MAEGGVPDALPAVAAGVRRYPDRVGSSLGRSVVLQAAVSPKISCHDSAIDRITKGWCHESACCAPVAGELSGWSEAWLLVCHGAGVYRSGMEAVCAEA
jgi:hypothetical protein